jgi:hypothetical protein
VADILTLAEARSAVGPLPAADTSADSDLTSTYIPAATAVVESIIGPVMAVTGLTFTVDGGRTSILLPSVVTAVTQVTESSTVLVANVDYTVNLRAGVVTRGSMQQPYIFLPGQSNIVVTYSAGAYAAAANVPAVLKLAARKIVRQLWLSDRVGRTQYGSTDTDLVDTPAGFAIPRAAYELLAGSRTVPGFA